MARTTLFYDIIAGRDTLKSALQSAAEQSSKLTNKLGGLSKKGNETLNKMSANANTLKGKLGSIHAGFSRSLGRMSERFKAWKIRNAAGMSDFFENIGAGGAVARIAPLLNPVTAIAAGALAVGSGLAVASEQAAIFENKFRAISNINQDKSAAELDRLKSKLSGFSFNQGVAPTETSTAYYDLQSATGKYGDEAIQILDKVNKFSVATQGNFVDNINASAKAMVQFGFGAEQLDEYLNSNAKTIQLGITTFEELGRVQTEYLGTAAAAGQSIDSANKLFAAMTSAGGNAQIAATLTKGALEGLSDSAITKKLEKQGVAIFDNSGKMLQLDKIAENLNTKIKGFGDNDKAFQLFKGEVGGNEGFKAFLAKIKSDGDELEQTFAKFDNIDFDVEIAYQLAQNDPIFLRKKIAAKFAGLTTEIGLNLGLKNVQVFLLKGIEKGLNAVWNTAKFIQNLNIGTRIGAGLAFINEKAQAVGSTFYGYLNGAYSLFKNNADILQPILIGTGIALVALNASAIFGAITAIPSLAAALGFAAIKFVVVNAAVLAFNTLLVAETIVLGTAAAATKIFALGQAALNIILTANPIGLVIAGVAALGVGLYIAYQKSETFRAGIAGVFAVIKGGFAIVTSFGKMLIGATTFNKDLFLDGFNSSMDAIKNFSPRKLFNEAFDEKLNLEAEAKINNGELLTIGVEQKNDLFTDAKGLLPALPKLPDFGKAIDGLTSAPDFPIASSPIPTAPTAPVNPTKPIGNLPSSPTADVLGDTTTSTSVNNIAGATTAGGKNINVSIGKLFENINITAQNIAEGADEVGEAITKAIVDAVRDAEIQLGY